MNQPNLLFVCCDQLRADCAGPERRYPVATPNMDRLAARGTWFANAFSTIPLCCPARQSMLCGRIAEGFGALWNFDQAIPVAALSPEIDTWPAALHRAGYKSAYIGKWHVSPEHTPLDFGYDEYVSGADYAQWRAGLGLPPMTRRNWLGEVDCAADGQSRMHYFADMAIERIARFARGASPWHIRLDFPEPHLPCCPSPEYAALYDPSGVPEWEGFCESFVGKPYIQRQQLFSWGVDGMGWSDWAPVVARYYSVITQLDASLGRVLDALEQSGQADNTAIIFTADHGDMCGSHGMLDKHYILYDDVVRVPLGVVLPAGAAGRTERRFAEPTLDLLPTICDICGVETEGARHGRSLMPLLLGAPAPDWRTEAVSTYNGQQFGLYCQRMLRGERYKYIWNLTDTDELYDLHEDPGELKNLIAEPSLAGELSAMRKRLFARLDAAGDPVTHGSCAQMQLLQGRKL